MTRRALVALFFCASSPAVLAGTIQRVTVSSVGTGPTLQQAIVNGLTNAVRQVDGVVIANEHLSQAAHLSLGDGNNRTYLTSQLYISRMVAATRGVVTGFVVQNYRHSSPSFLGGLGRLFDKDRRAKAEVWTARLQVTVAKFARSADEKRVRIVVFLPKTRKKTFSVFGTAVSAQGVASDLTDRLQNVLIGSHDFTVLNQRPTPELKAEMRRIRAGKTPARDYALLGQTLVADYVLVGAVQHLHYDLIRRPALTGHHVYVTAQGVMQATYKLVNVPTHQVVWSGGGRARFSRFMPFGGAPSATAVLDGALARISQRIGQSVMHYLFPIRILAKHGAEYVIGAGRGVVRVGQVYAVMREGTAIPNPDTHQSLGHARTYVGRMRIVRVQQRLAYGRLLPPARTLQGFRPMSYVLGRASASTTAASQQKAEASGMDALQAMIQTQDDASQGHH